MRFISILIFLYLTLFANFDTVDTFVADFKQSILNEQNKKITYSGKVYIKKPIFALWEYKEPVLKQVFLKGDKVVIIEPELEQVIITKLNDSIDFFKILTNSAKISEKIYETIFEGQKYLIFLDEKLVKRIQFIDRLDNKVDIEFSSQRVNETILDNFFSPKIPQEYDVITE